MTKEEAAAEQNRILLMGSNLGWWFGTDCEKCCGVFPRFHDNGGAKAESCWYECDVCGKRTEKKSMPWIARDAWNRHEYQDGQIRFC